MKTQTFRLYAKQADQKRFSPMDYGAGQQVVNLIFATVFSATEAAKLKAELPALHDLNPGWSFEVRGLK